MDQRDRRAQDSLGARPEVMGSVGDEDVRSNTGKNSVKIASLPAPSRDLYHSYAFGTQWCRYFIANREHHNAPSALGKSASYVEEADTGPPPAIGRRPDRNTGLFSPHDIAAEPGPTQAGASNAGTSPVSAAKPFAESPHC